MKKNFLLLLVFFAGLFTSHAQAQESNMDSVSYSLGILMAQNLKSQGFENLDANSMAAAMNAVLKDEELAIDQKSCTNDRSGIPDQQADKNNLRR